MKKLLLVLSSALLATACITTTPQQPTVVYINSGAIQCESPGKTGAETALLLTEQNIAVSDTQCAQLAEVSVIAMCGAPTININLHSIKAADLEKAQALGFKDVATLKQAGSLGYTVSTCK